MTRVHDVLSITIAAGLIGAASILPWSVTNSHRVYAHPNGVQVHRLSSDGTLTAWNSSLSYGSIHFPNSLVLLAAGFLTSSAWSRVKQLWSVPRWVTLAVAGYAVFHTGRFLVMIWNDHSASLGAGILITLGASVWLFFIHGRQTVVAWKQRRQSCQPLEEPLSVSPDWSLLESSTPTHNDAR